MIVRKGTQSDIKAVTVLYEKVHTAEEKGETLTGWKRGIYPTKATVEAALSRDDLFVMEEDGKIVAVGVLNKIQVDVYESAPWKYPADDSEVMVMHTLAVDPERKRRGYGRSFVKFYENYAIENNCPYLRIDTNEINLYARKLYKSMGYEEIATVPCVFNGLEGVGLVLLEKYLDI